MPSSSRSLRVNASARVVEESLFDLTNQIAVKCPLCSEQFHLHYTEDEWHRVNTMLKSAKRALREDHKSRYKNDSIALTWIPH